MWTSSSVRWKFSLKLNAWAEPGTMQEIISRPWTMILWKYYILQELSSRRVMSRWARAVILHGPVVGALCLFTNSRVFLISDQPVKFRVGSQAQNLPAFDGDVAAASVEVTQDHHVLGDWGEAEEEVPSAEIAHERAFSRKQEMMVWLTLIFHFSCMPLKTAYSWSISFMAFLGQVCCPISTKSFTTARDHTSATAGRWFSLTASSFLMCQSTYVWSGSESGRWKALWRKPPSGCPHHL